MRSHHAASGNEAQAWIAARLADLDLRLIGSDEPRVRPWSTVQRIETDGGPVWFKANGPGTTYEPALVEALAELAPGHVLDPLATDVEVGWALVPDGGRILRSFDDDVVLSHWLRILPAYAELQRATSDHVRDLVGRGVPDARPQRLPERFSALLDDTDVLLVDRPGGLSREQLSRLRDLEPTYAEWCARLDGAGIPPSIEHGDLHDGNVFVRDGGYAIFDWGDACVGHPFASLLVTLSSIAHRYDLPAGAAELAGLRDAYLEPWADGGRRAELAETVRLATRVTRSPARCRGTGRCQRCRQTGVANTARPFRAGFSSCSSRTCSERVVPRDAGTTSSSVVEDALHDGPGPARDLPVVVDECSALAGCVAEDAGHGRERLRVPRERVGPPAGDQHD